MVEGCEELALVIVLYEGQLEAGYYLLLQNVEPEEDDALRPPDQLLVIILYNFPNLKKDFLFSAQIAVENIREFGDAEQGLLLT